MASEIKYKDEVVATVDDGNAIAIKRRGKRMTTNVSVTFRKPGTLSYNGCTFVVGAGKRLVLKCADKKLKTDVVVSAISSEKGVRLVTSDGYRITDLSGLPVTVSYNSYTLVTSDGYELVDSNGLVLTVL